MAASAEEQKYTCRYGENIKDAFWLKLCYILSYNDNTAVVHSAIYKVWWKLTEQVQ